MGFFIANDLLAQSAICNYKYRKRITFDPAQVAGPIDLTNYVALIKIEGDADLATLANSGYVENTSGFDISFTADDGVTPLLFQMEYYASAAGSGSYSAWVRIPSLSTSINTNIYMYYGNSAIVTDQSTNSIWTNYHGVWHLQNNNFNDNSPSGANLTNNGTTNQTLSQINDGRADDGTRWLEVANTFPNMSSSFTMSGWFYTTNNTKAGQRVFCDDVNNTGGYALSVGDGGTGRVRFYSRGTNPVILDAAVNLIANNTWYYIVGVADLTNKIKKIYINGVEVATGSFLNAWGTDAGNCSIAGETAAGETANRLIGRIDEVRVAKAALSADWIATEFNNQNSPSTFYTISAAPKVWVGGTSTDYNTASNWLGNNLPVANEDVIINNGSNQPTLLTNQQVGGIWIRNGATLSLSNRNLVVRYDITNCGTISGNTGRVRCASTNAYCQNQFLSGSGNYNLFNFEINNTYSLAPSVILAKDVNVDGLLNLLSGIVYTSNTNILALSNSATSSSGLATSFVSGPISKNGATDFVFPVGKGTKWRRCEITNITAASTFTAEYFDTPYANTSSVNTPLFNVSLVEYWTCDRTGTGNANLGLYWEDASLSGINNCPDLTIARWNGASWDERLGTAVGTCSGTGAGAVTTNAALTAFSPFTFGSRNGGATNPLPIELLDFSVVSENNNARLNWVTAAEKVNAIFEIERSRDADHVEKIGELKGSGNSTQTHHYTLVDEQPLEGLSYYRLKQIDLDGTISYSAFRSLNFKSNTLLDFEIYPNPNNGEFVISKVNMKSSVIKIYDYTGNEVPFLIHETNLVNKLTLKANAGIYFVAIEQDGIKKVKKLIIE